MSSDNSRTMVIVAYVLHLLGACTGFLSIIALVMNYVCKGECARASTVTWPTATTAG
jgi:uncharacterized membrane protein